MLFLGLKQGCTGTGPAQRSLRVRPGPVPDPDPRSWDPLFKFQISGPEPDWDPRNLKNRDPDLTGTRPKARPGQLWLKI